MQKNNRSCPIKMLDRDDQHGKLMSADVGGSDLVSRSNGKRPVAAKAVNYSDIFMKRKRENQTAFAGLDEATKKLLMEKAAAFPKQDNNKSYVKEKDDEQAKTEDNNNIEDITTKEMVLREAPIGKGLYGALRWLREQGALNQTVEPMSGRNTDKKKYEIVDGGGAKEICIERKDKYGRDLTPKQAFRELSYKFHGKEPGRKKQEEMMKLYQDELRLKQGSSFDASVERMRKTQAELKTPYLVLDGYVKP